MGGLEGRYWLGSHQKRENSEVLTGHFFGLYVGGGKYDLQWKENGYQGEFFIAANIPQTFFTQKSVHFRQAYKQTFDYQLIRPR